MKRIITKFINNEATDEECYKLEEWLKEDDNKLKFKEYLRINYMLKANESFKGMEFDNVIEEYRANKKNIFKLIPLKVYKLAVASCVLLFICYGIFIKTLNSNNREDHIIVEHAIVPGSNKAILTLEDGIQISLEEGSGYESDFARGSEKELVYQNSTSTKSNTVVYNYLTVPRGGQFFVKLSDGTKVWLNSESKLKYPVNFEEGKSRNVELLYGEAYFDVAHSEEHEGAEFRVISAGQEIEVLGTEFNVKAYQDEGSIYTTLLKGSIALHSSNEYVETLVPGQQAVLNKGSNNIIVSKVETSYEIAWRDGLFNFKNKSLEEIMKVLSRWYDVDVIFEDDNMKGILFNGQISKSQNIEKILSLIKNTNFINAYEIKNNKIILKK
ncbi:FecR family protein [Mariniflexile sp. HMF6888]|uniref:FecR family protein n=1 Tax=Mariniflexile sp. HMF6888 TaxID=3373086 RepID=UPI0037A1346F